MNWILAVADVFLKMMKEVPNDHHRPTRESDGWGMTHDELLEAIDFLPLDGLHAWFQPALRAVVELHKPEWVLLKIVLGGTKPDPVAICNHCSDDQWRKSYPCPTIQAIEKELGL